MTGGSLPAMGLKWEQLEEILLRYRLEDPSWTEMRCHSPFFGWPNPPDNLFAIAKQANNLFYNHMWLGRKSMPSGQHLIDEVSAMTREILRGPAAAHTTLTSGGTESIFLAVLAARNFARKRRSNLATLNIVIPYSAHPAFDKACHFLGLEVIRTPLEQNGRANIDALREAITDKTVLIAGSAPSFAHGVCDDIPALAAISIEKDVWMHVDACVGGFLLPFLRRIGEPEIPFDFAVDGVRSISADLHKFGYVPRCLSSFTLRDSTDREHHTFTFSNWPCGDYVTEVQAGTRVTSVVASAWVVMKYLGEEGYKELARQLLDAARQYQRGIEAIPGLRLVGKPEAGILVYTSDTLDILKIADNLIAAVGTPLIVVPEIPGIHMLLQPIQHPKQVEHYLTTLSRVTDSVRRGEDRVAVKDHSYA